MTLTEKMMDLSQAWKLTAEVFPYFERLGIDWDGTYREFLRRDLETECGRDHWLLLAEFLNQLGDGHTDFQFPRKMLDEKGYLPFNLDYHGGRYYVDGDRVLGMNGQTMDQMLEQIYRYSYHVDSFVPQWRMRAMLPMLLKPEGNTLETEAGVRPFDLQNVGLASPARGNGMEIRELGKILYVRLDDMMQPGREGEIRSLLAGKTGVILDLRKNMGGMTAYGARIAELFMDGTFHACKKWTRTMKGVELASAAQMGGFQEKTIDFYVSGGLCTQEDVERWRRLWNRQQCEEYVDTYGKSGQKAAFSGPVVLLIGRDTVSAAEDFVAMFRTNRRALILGEPTQGTSGTTLTVNLAAGAMRVCTVGYRLLDGTEFIGTGIQPDVLMVPTPEDIREGRDSVLEFARNYLQ